MFCVAAKKAATENESGETEGSVVISYTATWARGSGGALFDWASSWAVDFFQVLFLSPNGVHTSTLFFATRLFYFF